jgi:hypothetical protein
MTWYLEAMALAFWLVIGFAALAAVVVFVLDRSQKADAIRRNYPVIGRFRGLFSTLGEFFRQYFFAMDREELPFNRAQREWVKHASEGGSNTLPFGSTRNISVVGTPIFTPAPFPPLDDQFASSEPMEIGPYARVPYMARSFFNISGMSYGAISKPAVRALSRGARMAGCWMNTGEGGCRPITSKVRPTSCSRSARRSSGCATPMATSTTRSCARWRRTRRSRCSRSSWRRGPSPGRAASCRRPRSPTRSPRSAACPRARTGSARTATGGRKQRGALDLIAHVREVTGKPVGIKTVMGHLAHFETCSRRSTAAGRKARRISSRSMAARAGPAPRPCR